MVTRHRGRNEGSLSQRPNGSWRAQISGHGDRIGKTFKTKKEAQAWLIQLLGQLNQGLDYSGGKITLSEYLPQWFSNSQQGLREKTTYQYGVVIRKHILPRIGILQLIELTLQKIEQFYSQLVHDGVGIRTVLICHNILHKAMEKALRYRLIPFNPCQGASLPRYVHGEMQVLDRRQISAFLAAAQDSLYYPIYYLAIVTGMRQGEILGLKWSDLEWNGGFLHVQRQVQDVPGIGTFFTSPKTRAGQRTISLSEGTLKILRTHRIVQTQWIDSIGDRWQANDLIFPSSVGTPINPSNLRKDFLRVLVNAGLSTIRFHDLRHTAASLMLNHGIPPLVVSKILGHSKPSITLDIYGHLYNEMQSEAARLMDSLVNPTHIVIKTG